MNIDDYVPKDNRGISKIDQVATSLNEVSVAFRNVEDFSDQELASYVMTYHRMHGQIHNDKEGYEAAGLAMLKGSRADARKYIESYRGRV